MDDARGLEREELEATLEVRRELGPSYEPALVDSFVDRIAAVNVAYAWQNRGDRP